MLATTKKNGRQQTGFVQQHKARLAREIASLRRQAEAFNAPSTYAKCAKLQRLANAKEQELAALQQDGERDARARAASAMAALKVRRRAAFALLAAARPRRGPHLGSWCRARAGRRRALRLSPRTRSLGAAGSIAVAQAATSPRDTPFSSPLTNTHNNNPHTHPPTPPPHTHTKQKQLALIALAVFALWGRALLYIPPRLSWPFSRLLLFPHSGTAGLLEAGAVTVLPWVALCDRVSLLIARALFPLRALEPRTRPLQTVHEEKEQ